MHARGDVALAMCLVAGGTVIWLPYALSTTFLYDDYAFVSHAAFSIPASDSHRPGSRVVAAGLTSLLGTHAREQYVAVVALAAIMAAAFYAALRAWRFPRVAAGIAASLTLIYPRADSLRLWWAATQLVVAIILACAAIAVIGRWVSHGRYAIPSLATGLALTVAAVLTYEATALVVLLPLALTPLARDKRRALAATSTLAVTAVVCAVYMFRNADPFQTEQGYGSSQWPRRFADLAADGWQTLFVGEARHSSVVVAVVGATGGLVVGSILLLVTRGRRAGGPRADRRRADPGTPNNVATVVTVCALLAGGFLAWLPFVPANAYYTPSAPSVGNRVNGVAQLFFLAALGLCLATGFTAGARAGRGAIPAVSICAALAGLVSATFALTSARHAADFVAAARLRQSILTTVHGTLPAPAHGETVILAGYDRTYSDEIIPVFAANWDFNGALKLLYQDGSLEGLPLDPRARCVDGGFTNGDPSISPVPYANLRFVDVATARALVPRDRVGCQAFLANLRAPV